MGFGQFSVTSIRRTKADQLQAAQDQGYHVVQSKRAGHNRLHFRTADGAEHFMLHVTVIASVNPERTQLTLNDGGWPSITTRKAFSEAAQAFGLPSLSVGGGRPRASHMLGFRVNDAESEYAWSWGRVVFDRTVTLTWDRREYALAPGCQPVAAPMVRAVVDGATSLEVTYRDGEVTSDAGDHIGCSPFRLLVTMADLLTLAKGSRKFIGRRHEQVDYRRELPIFKGAYYANGGRLGRAVHVGCHEFSVSDLRNVMQRVQLDHPEAAKAAKAFIRSRKASPIITLTLPSS